MNKEQKDYIQGISELIDLYRNLIDLKDHLTEEEKEELADHLVDELQDLTDLQEEFEF